MRGSVVTGIVDDLIDGEDDISKIEPYRHGEMHVSQEELAKSLVGNLTAHH